MSKRLRLAHTGRSMSTLLRQMSYRAWLLTVTVTLVCTSKECAHKTMLHGSAFAAAICRQHHTAKMSFDFFRSRHVPPARNLILASASSGFVNTVVRTWTHWRSITFTPMASSIWMASLVIHRRASAARRAKAHSLISLISSTPLRTPRRRGCCSGCCCCSHCCACTCAGWQVRDDARCVLIALSCMSCSCSSTCSFCLGP